MPEWGISKVCQANKLSNIDTKPADPTQTNDASRGWKNTRGFLLEFLQHFQIANRLSGAIIPSLIRTSLNREATIRNKRRADHETARIRVQEGDRISNLLWQSQSLQRHFLNLGVEKAVLIGN